MRGVEDHRHAERPHREETGEIVDEPAVAEERAALAEQMSWQPPASSLATDVPHVGGGDELPLLHVDGPARRGGRQEEVGLPAEEGGDLQQVADLRPPAAACSGRCMSVVTGRPVARRTRSSTASPASSPGPRKAPPLVRLALSNEALKTTWIEQSRREHGEG